MRWLSLSAAAAEARRTLLRFPAVLACGFVAAITAGVLVGNGAWRDSGVAVFVAAALGLPLLTALTLTGERLSRPAWWTLQLFGLAVLAVFAWAWPAWPEPVQTRRFVQFSVGFHLLVAFLPFTRRGELNGFWQFNRALFLRFLLASLYSVVLYGGITVALVALNQLFKVKLPRDTYADLWFLLSFVFNTWFFLAGVPPDLGALEQRRDYPQGLKGFAQFVLIPLVALYLVILTAYLGRILVTGQWPSGWIGYLVSSVAALGILSLLLVHPIRELEENRWVATYARWFYVAMLPSIGMLLVAIGKRVAQYGVTEDRYFIAVLSVWLTGVAVAFIARRHTDIRFIPFTLCVLAFATAFGPWGAFSISRVSQIQHLESLLRKHGLLGAGSAHPAIEPVSFETRKELSSTLVYLMGTHGARVVKPLLGAAVPDSLTTKKPGDVRGATQGQVANVMKNLGLEFVASWEGQPSASFWYTWSQPASPAAIDVSSMDYHVRLLGAPPMEFSVHGTIWRLRVDNHRRRVELETAGEPSLSFPLDTLVERARHSGINGLPPALQLTAGTAARHALWILRSYGGIAGDTVQFHSLDGDLYLSGLGDSTAGGTGTIRPPAP